MRSLGLFSRLSRTSRAFPILQRRGFGSSQPTAMDYDTILQGKYPAKRHAQRVTEYIRSKIPNATGVLYLESRATKLLEDNDEAEPFRYAPSAALSPHNGKTC